MPFIMLVIAAFCCTLASIWGPGRPDTAPWYGRIDIGWFGLALYLWSLVLVSRH
jgi:hypothetical protein